MPIKNGISFYVNHDNTISSVLPLYKDFLKPSHTYINDSTTIDNGNMLYWPIYDGETMDVSYQEYVRINDSVFHYYSFKRSDEKIQVKNTTDWKSSSQRKNGADKKFSVGVSIEF